MSGVLDPVGYAEDRRLLDSGVRDEEVLELNGVDLVAAPDHDVFDAVEQVDEALGVDAAAASRCGSRLRWRPGPRRTRW